jgi:pilus assembly protein CpaE
METVVADLDVAVGTAGLNFNQDIPPGITDVLSDPDRVDATLIERMLVKAADKLSIFGGPGGVERDFQIEPAAIESVLTALRASVPYAVLDLPTIWVPWVKYTLLHADQVIVTATPELASLRNARSLIDAVKGGRPNDAPPILILNQVGVPKRPEISAADFSKAVGVPVSGAIPYDAHIFGTAQGNGQTILEVAPKSKSAEAILDLAHLLTRTEKPAKKPSMAAVLRDKMAILRKK